MSEEENTGTLKPYYANMYDFFEGFVSVVHRRSIMAQDVHWCPWWHLHPEAQFRMDLLYRSFESVRANGVSDLNSWTLSTFDPMMRTMMEPYGTFDGCSVKKHVDRKGDRGKLPYIPAARIVRPERGPLGGNPEPKFANEYEFFEDFISLIYRRKVEGKYKCWCPMWFAHPEAVYRMSLMHRTFEERRLGDLAQGIASWMVDTADPHMNILMAPDGPFAGCKREHRLYAGEAGHLPYILHDRSDARERKQS